MDSKKAAVLYFSVSAIAMLVTACAGFKAELIEGAGKGSVSVITPRGQTGNGDNTGSGGSGVYAAPAYQIQISNSMPIIEFMASQNPEVQNILNDPNFMGPPYIAGRMSLNIVNLSANNSVSAGMGSQLRFQGILSGATGVEIRMESTDARLYMNTNASQYEDVITGSWTFTSDSGTVSMDISASPVRNANQMMTSQAYNLEGDLWARFGNSGAAELLGTFSIPLCAVMTDTSWIQDPAANCGTATP